LTKIDKITKYCLTCHTPFQCYPSSTQKYCSRVCFYQRTERGIRGGWTFKKSAADVEGIRERMKGNKNGTFITLAGRQKLADQMRIVGQSNKGRKLPPERVEKLLSYVKGKHPFSRDMNYCESLLLSTLWTWGYPFEYVGDFSFRVGRKSPDFKLGYLLIEHCGEAWHTPEEMLERVAFFKTKGYDTLVIWNKELLCKRRIIENNIKLRQRVDAFMSGRPTMHLSSVDDDSYILVPGDDRIEEHAVSTKHMQEMKTRFPTFLRFREDKD
jgi:hypothetical protein